MNYIEKTLAPGERVVYQTRLHWIVMTGHFLAALFLLILPGAFLLYYVQAKAQMQVQTAHLLDLAGIGLLCAGLFVLLMGRLRRNATEMAVTNRRVVVKKGLASRTTIEMLLNRVETIEVSEPTLGRLLGYGSIVMIGTGGTSEQFHDIDHPLVFRSHVQQQIENLLPPQPEVPVRV